MNNWPSHVTKTRHLAARQNRPRLIESYKRASDWPKRSHVGHFLRLRQAGPPIQSQFSLHSDFAFVFVHGLVFSIGWVPWTLHIDRTSLNLHDGRIFCFHVGTCVKARPIKWKRGQSPWIIFRGDQICNNEYMSKNSNNVEFDCIMNAFFDERKYRRHVTETDYREVKHDVNGRRQTAKITSDFEFFSSNP